MSRVYKNAAEQAFNAQAQAKGWKISKRGWPDFMRFLPDGSIEAYEVKPRTQDGKRTKCLKREQYAAMIALSRCGVKCYLSDGTMHEPFHPDKHRPRTWRVW